MKFVLRAAWLSTFSRDAIRILCLSLAGRWWRAEFISFHFVYSFGNFLTKSNIRYWFLVNIGVGQASLLPINQGTVIQCNKDDVYHEGELKEVLNSEFESTGRLYTHYFKLSEFEKTYFQNYERE